MGRRPCLLVAFNLKPVMDAAPVGWAIMLPWFLCALGGRLQALSDTD